MRGSRTHRHHDLWFFYRVIGVIFVAIFVVSTFRELFGADANRNGVSQQREIPTTGPSRPLESPHIVRTVEPKKIQQSQQSQQSQQEQKKTIPQYMVIEGARLRSYGGVIPMRSGETSLILVLPNTGYYTLKIYGDDITAGVREPTVVQFSCSGDKYTWDFVDKIALEFHDVFAIAGTRVFAKYIAPAGYITYIGLNITAQMRTNILPGWVYGMNV